MKTEICISITVCVDAEGKALSRTNAKGEAGKALVAAGHDPNTLYYKSSRRFDFDKIDVKYYGP